MKTMKLITGIGALLFASAVIAQDTSSREKFGNTLNLGAGVGYFGYVGHPMPVGTINYEIDIARDFTLSPFVGMYSYRNYYYWGHPNKPYDDDSYRMYSYRVTAVPVGVKGTYYFDRLFHANPKWDFYAGASAGFVFRTVTWENAYYGDKHVYHHPSPLYLDGHVGAEYHINEKAGLFLDLSTRISTVGLALHF